MEIAALFSGGKDSMYATYLASKKHHIRYLATVHSVNPDSYMYHTPNIGFTLLQSQAMGIQLVSKETFGEKEKEVKDLEILLKGLSIGGVVCGAIASKYQKERIEKICKKLKLKLLSPLWGKDPQKYLKNLLKDKFEVIITAVAAEGFEKSWLGRKIDNDCIKALIKLNKEHGVHLAGEGGEFETAVLDCPLFKRKIKLTETNIRWKKNNGFLEILNAKFIDKN